MKHTIKIDQETVENIRRYGVYTGLAGEEERYKFLKEDIGFKMDEKADYVIIASCLQPSMMPNAFRALKNLLDYFDVSYTLLSKEYCCGYMPFVLPALMMRDEEEIKEAKAISEELLTKNIENARSFGAKSIVIFCAACDIMYSSFKGSTDLEVIHYPELIDRYFKGGRLDLEADFYAGCYRARRKVTPEPADVDSSLSVLNRIEGLKLNRLSDDLCCARPNQLDKLIESMTTTALINICSGCYNNTKSALQEKGSYRTVMLPEVVWASLRT